MFSRHVNETAGKNGELIRERERERERERRETAVAVVIKRQLKRDRIRGVVNCHGSRQAFDNG